MTSIRRAHGWKACLGSALWLFAACAGEPAASGAQTDMSAPAARAASAADTSAAATAPSDTRSVGLAGPVAGQPAPANGSPASQPEASASQPMASDAAPANQAESATEPASAGEGDSGWCAAKLTLDTRCTVCHNEQKVAGAPMSLETYEDLQAPAVSDSSRRVYELVQERIHDKQRPMPPQDPLTSEQIAGLDAWIAGGAAAGDDTACADNVLPEEPERSWPSNCDETYEVRAASKDSPNIIDAASETHPQVTIPAPWGDEEVQAIAWHSINDNVKVLHHWILYGPSREFLFGWAPGKDWNQPLPDDVGVYLPSGSLTLDMHYNNVTGTEAEADASGVKICVLKKEHFRPKTATITMALAQGLINIPPRAVDQDVTGVCTHAGDPVRLLSVSPHAHKYANHMKFSVEKANGMTIVMHDQDFNFNEQTTYALDPPVEVEAGDRIITTCTYTNESAATVTFGENTENEMCFNFAMYEPMGGLNCGGGFGF